MGTSESKTFHFRIDISAADGTTVYATASRRIVVEAATPRQIAFEGGGDVVLRRIHIPAVRNGQTAIAYGTVLGHIAPGWGHVHLAELVGGRYVNPLRRRTVADTQTRPARRFTFSFERDGKAIDRTKLSGASTSWRRRGTRRRCAFPASGRTSLSCRPSSGGAWCSGRAPDAWRTAIDFSETIPAPGLFDTVYGRWTRQNHPWRSGRYRVRLALDWDSAAVNDGVPARSRGGRHARQPHEALDPLRSDEPPRGSNAPSRLPITIPARCAAC